MGGELLATGPGGGGAKPRRRPSACRHWKQMRAPAHAVSGAGSPRCVESRVDYAAWGSHVGKACRQHSCLPTSQVHTGPWQNIWGRRRGFAPAQPGRERSRFAGRRDEYVDAARPKRARLDEGIEQLPPALARPG